MKSREILPLAMRLTEDHIENKFGTFSGEFVQFDELITRVIRYESALSEVETNCYKWRMDKLTKFPKLFKWDRIKTGQYLSFSKLNYYFYRDLLKKYIYILPSAEMFYEEKRIKTIAKINDINIKHENNKR